MSGSPLFTGNAGQGETEIRRWLLEYDLIDAIVALPTDIFFRTGIGTYIWLLDNNKPEERQNKVQLIDASNMHTAMRKAEGNKRRYVSNEQAQDIARLYADYAPSENVRIVDYRDFGYRRIKVQRPLRLVVNITDEALVELSASKAFAKLDVAEQDMWLALLSEHKCEIKPYEWLTESLPKLAKNAGLSKVSRPLTKAFQESLAARDLNAPEVRDDGGNPVPDKELEDFETVPLSQGIEDYFATEILPHAPDAWIDCDYVDESDGQVGKVGYEINFNRYFYKYVPPRDLNEIDSDLKITEAEIAALLNEVAE